MDPTHDWTQFYTSTADSTVVSTGMSPTRPALEGTGRVGKTARRRTRASRRAPTTLLNTDPTNFRAMVQQFTGAPTGPYSGPARPVISFGFGGDRIQQSGPGAGLGQFGQYGGQQFDGAVMLPAGNVSNGGFVQGFDLSGGNSANSVGFLDGDHHRAMGGNSRTGGYFL